MITVACATSPLARKRCGSDDRYPKGRCLVLGSCGGSVLRSSFMPSFQRVAPSAMLEDLMLLPQVAQRVHLHRRDPRERPTGNLSAGRRRYWSGPSTGPTRSCRFRWGLWSTDGVRDGSSRHLRSCAPSAPSHSVMAAGQRRMAYASRVLLVGIGTGLEPDHGPWRKTRRELEFPAERCVDHDQAGSDDVHRQRFPARSPRKAPLAMDSST